MSVSCPISHTRRCELLGIDYPTLHSGMGGIAGPELVASVPNAGGLKILAGFLLPADQLREAIRAIRRQTEPGTAPRGGVGGNPETLRHPGSLDSYAAASKGHRTDYRG